MKTAKDIRQDFIAFFKERDQRFVRSSPVVPIDDPTLLFTNAGFTRGGPYAGRLSAWQAQAAMGLAAGLFTWPQ